MGEEGIMEQLLKDFTSTYWWLILLIGLTVGIIGTFMADGIKKLWGLFSSRQRERNKKREQEYDYEINILVRHPERIQEYILNAIYQGILGLTIFVGAGIMWIASITIPYTDNVENFFWDTPIIARPFFYFVSLIGVFLSMRVFNFSKISKRKASDAQRKLRKSIEEQEKVKEEEIPRF